MSRAELVELISLLIQDEDPSDPLQSNRHAREDELMERFLNEEEK